MLNPDDALADAARIGNLAALDQLCRSGANPVAHNGRALCLAVCVSDAHARLLTIARLLDAGASDRVTKGRAINLAVELCDLDATHLLLRYPVDVNARGGRAMRVAIATRQIAMIDLLRSAGATTPGWVDAAFATNHVFASFLQFGRHRE